ncbi:4-hydroxybenzoate 3-monooxygenase [Mycolicibacterium austroafricanum]|uniref:4-hydroxybenzoate 3-monooxygenase n=1 Tax=Mycolicibacterium austroafricanum TaxID=39687 RepID=UPI00056AF618|nr:4-hydroxybenzoate 3-monooxygenase [Mycolicibacterium austroafricanum]QZY47062.1 4-hydroxybenzoate 3-monooxygenase [Mycolicibacterium austroafricanum]
MRTQVAIIGAGPAGMLLSHLLAADGVDSIVIEARTEEYVLARIRAGILEHSSVELLRSVGLGDRLSRNGIEHRGIYLQTPGERRHLDFVDLVGRSVWVYGQTEVQKDLVAARHAAGQQIVYEAADVAVHDIETERPYVTFTVDGAQQRVEADVIAGCDGSFGPSRAAVPKTVKQVWEKTYPYSWLGVLADVPPSTDELIYAWHPDGFAMHSMRSDTVSRLYLQVPNDTDVGSWSHDRIWDALSTRLGAGIEGWTLQTGPITESSVLPMRSYVQTPMRHGQLFLAGDAAHIVPPTGAKGLNLAIADVSLLAPALIALLKKSDPEQAANYSANALQRVWRCTHFSWWMTSMLHISGDSFDAQLQQSQLRWVASSRAAAMGLAENYAGLPLNIG